MKISIREVKQALKNQEFRKSLPAILKEDIAKYESNPNCPCNLDVYRNVIRHASSELKRYYNAEEIIRIETPKLSNNHWVILDCSIQELAGELNKLSSGRKQLALARYEDQISVIINELDEGGEDTFLMQNYWRVINCSVAELAEQIKKLEPGRKQITMARYLDKVTVVLNELGMTV